jgi:hypothetical protein
MKQYMLYTLGTNMYYWNKYFCKYTEINTYPTTLNKQLLQKKGPSSIANGTHTGYMRQRHEHF